MTPLKAIKAKCLDCCCDDRQEVKLCPSTDCPLYEYRFGKTGRTREMTEEQKVAFVERVRKSKDNA